MSYLLDLYVISILERRGYVTWLVIVNLLFFALMMALMPLMPVAFFGIEFVFRGALLLVSAAGMAANLRFLFFVVISESRLRGMHVRDRHNQEIEVANLANRRSIVLLVLSYMGSLTCGIFLISAGIMTAVRYGWLRCADELCRQAGEGPLVASITLGNFLDQATLFVAGNWFGVALLYLASLLKLVLVSLILPALLAYREAGSGAGGNNAG